MARRTLFSYDVGDLQLQADKLADVEGLEKNAALIATLNKVVDDVYETARGRMNAGINLTDAYIQSRMAVEHATPSTGLRAAIVARGGRADQTLLRQYMVRQATRSAPNAKGDPRRNIAPGTKAAGVEVEVGRGRNVTITGAFTLPLNKGGASGGNGIGIFTRSKYGLVKHRYGPAPYQLFRVAAAELDESTADTLQEQLAGPAQEALMKALT